MTKWKFPALKIRTRLLLQILIGVACALLLSEFLFRNTDAVFDAVKTLPLFYLDVDALSEQAAAYAKDLDLPDHEIDIDVDNPGAAEAYLPFYELCDPYTGLAFYSEDDGFFRFGFPPRILSDPNSNNYFWRAIDLISLNSTWYAIELISLRSDLYHEEFTVTFRNGDATVFVSNYRVILFGCLWFFTVALLAVILLLGIVLHYINSRIRDILILHEETALMASGDLAHTVPCVGRDEIGELGCGLDSLRIALLENIRQEEAARDANRDLIAALSHDLRTPLTILNGYLEVLKLESATPAARADYLGRCLQKTAEIKELTDRMFEYALVYEVDETPEFVELQTDFLRQCLLENLDFIRLAGFRTEISSLPEDAVLRGDPTMLKRILNNLFSNILKYGDKGTAISLSASTSDGSVRIRLTNAVKPDANASAGSHIGLKSAQKMAALHHGTLQYDRCGKLFAVSLTLPAIAPVSDHLCRQRMIRR